MDKSITETDLELIERAKLAIIARFDTERHHIGSALISSSGKVFTGIHVEASVGRIALCAEASAISRMRTDTADFVDTIVAVRCPRQGAKQEEVEIVAPCGMCRELISDYGRDAMVILYENGGTRKVPVKSLLPHRFEPSHGRL